MVKSIDFACRYTIYSQGKDRYTPETVHSHRNHILQMQDKLHDMNNTARTFVHWLTHLLLECCYMFVSLPFLA